MKMTQFMFKHLLLMFGMVIFILDEYEYRNNIAEQDLKEMERQPFYVALLLRYISDASMRSEHRLMVVVFLKNLVKKDWDVNLILRPEDKELIKQGVVELLFSTSDTKIQDVLSEIITIISEFDFYKNWTSLLPVSRS